MTTFSATRVNRWLVCESEDRWYRGICRYIPEIVRNDAILRVERIGSDWPQTILQRVKAATDQTVVLWELPDIRERPTDFLMRMEIISLIRLETPNTIQVASLPPSTLVEAFLLAQEAGITFFLEGLWSLPSVGKAAPLHFSPLG